MPPYRKAGLTSDGQIVIATTYDPGLVAQIKEGVPGRKWDGKRKMWYAPLSYPGLLFLLDNKFEIGVKLEEAYLQLAPQKVVPFKFRLHKKCFPYQKEGVYFLESRKGRALLGDDMGLGKTLQVLAWADHHKELRPLLAVVPNTVKLAWKEEVKKWLPKEKLYIITGRPDSLKVKMAKSSSILVTNYETVPNRWKTKTVVNPTIDRIKAVATTITQVVFKHESKTFSYQIENGNYQVIKQALHRFKPRSVNVTGYEPGWEEVFTGSLKPRIFVVDECQYIKNAKAQRTASVMKIGEVVEHVITLSGTPIINRPSEFYTSLLLTNPNLFPDWWHFTGKFCDRKRTPFGVDVSGVSNPKELHQLLTETVMLRRRKKDVRKDLPDKLISVVRLELSNRAEYRRAEADTIAWIRKTFGQKAASRAERAEVLASINYLKQLCAKGKLSEAFEWISDALETGEKLIVFCIHQKVVDGVVDRFKSVAVKLTGKEDLKQKEQAINSFQKGKAQLLVANIKTGGVGLNLTAANRIAFLELGWTPAEHEQAEDRVVRSGQTADCVNIYYLLADHTIEDHIIQLLDAKRGNIGEVLDGKSQATGTILWDLLAEMSKKGK